MAMQKRFRVEHSEVFPAGAFLKGQAEPVLDFNAPRREDGSRPQVKDKDTGLLLWQVVVLDADEEAVEAGDRAVGEDCGEGGAGAAGEHDGVAMDAGGVRRLDRVAVRRGVGVRSGSDRLVVPG